MDFTPHVEDTLLKAYKARNIDRLDSWHLLEVVVDPDWQGKGSSFLPFVETFDSKLI